VSNCITRLSKDCRIKVIFATMSTARIPPGSSSTHTEVGAPGRPGGSYERRVTRSVLPSRAVAAEVQHGDYAARWTFPVLGPTRR